MTLCVQKASSEVVHCVLCGVSGQVSGTILFVYGHNSDSQREFLWCDIDDLAAANTSTPRVGRS